MYVNPQKLLPQSGPRKTRSLEQARLTDIPSYLPEFEVTWKRWSYCRIRGLGNETFLLCPLLFEASFVEYFGHATAFKFYYSEAYSTPSQGSMMRF